MTDIALTFDCDVRVIIYVKCNKMWTNIVHRIGFNKLWDR